jgi:hypothetical protein
MLQRRDVATFDRQEDWIRRRTDRAAKTQPAKIINCIAITWQSLPAPLHSHLLPVYSHAKTVME